MQQAANVWKLVPKGPTAALLTCRRLAALASVATAESHNTLLASSSCRRVPQHLAGHAWRGGCLWTCDPGLLVWVFRVPSRFRWSAAAIGTLS